MAQASCRILQNHSLLPMGDFTATRERCVGRSGAGPAVHNKQTTRLKRSRVGRLNTLRELRKSFGRHEYVFHRFQTQTLFRSERDREIS
ncbi:tRNA-specific 2-thiouridylase [Frankliniella fusca]|uniref:tRNA-specific 2-thiouridylase n=1 Tax=Frankliniella fusca TaxID=407009 RepID=A0AAE1H4R2_9NEOP|nr:tRNA-specific 2-thiouridylase [Frankliniella fusca]KAK3926541.1 tRNA-specific 2-thiouridylase [Frankliniella fusca]